jgi:hypothetical protein
VAPSSLLNCWCPACRLGPGAGRLRGARWQDGPHLRAPTAQVLALMDPHRCRHPPNLQRLGLRAEARAADAGEPGYWWDGQPFDAILRIPCTASGIARRARRALLRRGRMSHSSQNEMRLLTAPGRC